MSKNTHIVIASVEEPTNGKYLQCSVIKKDAIFLGIYRKVYGPATKRECKIWAKNNCAGGQTKNTHIVIASVEEPTNGKYLQCSVIKKYAIFLGTHRKVYGPVTKRECKIWAENNCADGHTK